MEAGEQQEDEDDDEGGEDEGADAEKRKGQDNDERGYDDDVDDDEQEIAEKTQVADLNDEVNASKLTGSSERMLRIYLLRFSVFYMEFISVITDLLPWLTRLLMETVKRVKVK